MFDKGFITISPDFTVMISDNLIKFEKEDVVRDFFHKYKNRKIIHLNKFLPTREILDYLHNNIFRK